jgi:filamentous hemagglutinin
MLEGVEADAVLGRLRSTLGEKNFREIESHILARVGGNLEFWNPNSTSLPRNGKRAVLSQKDAPSKPEVACGPTSCGMILNDLGKPVNMGALVQQANLTPAGARIDRIASILQASGVKNARWVSNISIDKLAKATSKGQPAIVHLNLKGGGHYVIVDGVTVRQGKKVIAIRDPNGPNGGRQYFAPVEEFVQKFSGNAVFTNTKTN